MAASPRWKVYRGREYVASCKYPEDAAALVALFGEGSTVRSDHSTVVWFEGKEEQSAGESYDAAATLMEKRARQNWVNTLAKQYGVPADLLERRLSEKEGAMLEAITEVRQILAEQKAKAMSV